MLETLKKHFEFHLDKISEEDWDKIVTFFEPLEFKKKDFLMRRGDLGNNQFFITDGCVRLYSIDKEGIEHILVFAPKNWWVGDLYSIIENVETDLFIDALMPTLALKLSRKNQLEMLKQYPMFEKYYRILLENHTVANQRRIRQNLEWTAKERYNYFCKTYPTLIKRIPQKLIAQYIGVTPEFLSKMLNN